MEKRVFYWELLYANVLTQGPLTYTCSFQRDCCQNVIATISRRCHVRLRDCATVGIPSLHHPSIDVSQMFDGPPLPPFQLRVFALTLQWMAHDVL